MNNNHSRQINDHLLQGNRMKKTKKYVIIEKRVKKGVFNYDKIF